jgi:hypothetical protein
LIHADEDNRVESFVVGKDVAKGEKAVWIVEGGKYKASYLLQMSDEKGENEKGDRLLISEVSGLEGKIGWGRVGNWANVKADCCSGLRVRRSRFLNGREV